MPCVLLIYAYAGTISMMIGPAYFVGGLASGRRFIVLSETRFNDRFDDHYLAVFQSGGHIAIQLGFLFAAPADRRDVF